MAKTEPETQKSGKPNLVAVDGDKKKSEPIAAKATQATAPARTEPEKSSRWGVWLLVLLMLGAGVAALLQTQRLQETTARVTALSEAVLGLEAQLSAANTQIATYEMQRGQIRGAVSDISQRVLALGEMVAGERGLSEPSAP